MGEDLGWWEWKEEALQFPLPTGNVGHCLRPGLSLASCTTRLQSTFPFPVHLFSPCPPCPPGHLSEEQLLLCGLALAGLHFPRWLCLLVITLQGLLFHLHSSQLLGLLLPGEPVQVRLLQEGLMLTELLLCLLGVALRLPDWLAGFGDNLQR